MNLHVCGSLTSMLNAHRGAYMAPNGAKHSLCLLTWNSQIKLAEKLKYIITSVTVTKEK